MAFMAKLQGYVYDGEHIAAEDLRNGDFAVIIPVINGNN